MHPHAVQLQEVKSAQTALDMVTMLCCEEGGALTAQALDELRKHMDEPVAAHAVKALDKPPAGKA